MLLGDAFGLATRGHRHDLGVFHVDPLLGFGGLEDGVADVLRVEGVFEVGVGFFGARIVEAFEKFERAMDEGVFVAEAEAGNPPVADVGLIAVGDMDAAPAASFAGHGVVKVGEAVEVVQIPGERFVFAVDFERFERFVAAGVTGGFKDGEGAVFKAGEEGAGIIDGDFLFFTRFLVHAFFDEGFRHGGNGDDFAVEPAGGVDIVCQKIARHAGAGCGGIETPESRAALREVFGHRPVLQEIGTVVEDATQVAALDDFFGQGDGGEETVVVPNEVGQSGFFDGLHHFLAFGAIECQGFFAENHFARLDGGEGDFGVEIVGGADVHGIDIIARDDFFPVGFGVGVAPFFGESFHVFLVAAADDLLDGGVFGVEKVFDLGVGVGVGAAHEAVADEADADWFFVHCVIS